MFADIFFLIGLLMKLLEIVLPKDKPGLAADIMIDMNGLAASGRILWGMAFALAILKTIKVKLIHLGSTPISHTSAWSGIDSLTNCTKVEPDQKIT